MFAYCLNNPASLVDYDGKFAGVDDAIFFTAAVFYVFICATALYSATPAGQRGLMGFARAVSQVIDDAASNVPVFKIEEECGSPTPGGNNDDDDDDDDDYYDNDENFGGREKIGKSKGQTHRNNQAQNKQFKEGTRGLTKSQQRQVHDRISKKGYGLEDII